jgi:hypothetical protein
MLLCGGIDAGDSFWRCWTATTTSDKDKGPASSVMMLAKVVAQLFRALKLFIFCKLKALRL